MAAPAQVSAANLSIPELIERISDGRTPDEVRRDPEIVLALSRALAHHSPAGLAIVTSRGRWQLYRHHQVMNDLIVKAVNKPEGRILVSVSVRGGKSLLGARYTPAWHLGCHPDDRVLLGAHEGPFAAEHSGFARDVLTEYGPALYDISVDRTSSARNRWEIEGHDGGMVAVGVGGSPIGKGGNLIVVDDPLKSFESAMSDLQRKRVNETWFQGSMSSRLEPGGSVIVICSRWHEEDLSGWLKANWPGDWDEIHIPAICDDPAEDLLGRELGESFWPERWPVDLLHKRESTVGPIVWLAQYQQRPTRAEGGIFPVGKLVPVYTTDRYSDTDIDDAGDPVLVHRGYRAEQITALCRSWDLAATEGDGDYTVGVLWGRYSDDRWIILDVVRGQWSESTVRQRIKDTAQADAERWGWGRVRITLPQDPGQAGKAQSKQLAAMLSGHPVSIIVPTGSKVTRAAGFAAQVQIGNVEYLADADWDVHAVVEELRSFPNGAHDDVVDAGSDGFNLLAGTVTVEDPMAGQAAYEGLTRRSHA